MSTSHCRSEAATARLCALQVGFFSCSRKLVKETFHVGIKDPIGTRKVVSVRGCWGVGCNLPVGAATLGPNRYTADNACGLFQNERIPRQTSERGRFGCVVLRVVCLCVCLMGSSGCAMTRIVMGARQPDGSAFNQGWCAEVQQLSICKESERISLGLGVTTAYFPVISGSHRHRTVFLEHCPRIGRRLVEQ